jgi:integrase
MPRQARPRWNAKRGQWFANIGEKDAQGRAREVFAPAAIGPKDEGAAWDWFKEERGRRETPVVAVASDVTAEAVCEHYLAWAEGQRDAGKLPGSEYANKARHLGIFADAFGPRPVAAIGPDDVTAFGERLLTKYAPVYARNVCATVRAALNWAAKKGAAPGGGRLIEANPIRGFRSPTIPRSPARFAQRAEAAAFLGYWRTRTDRTTTRGRYERLTLLMERALIRTGARPKELCRLEWRDIQWNGWTTKTGHVGAKGVLPYDRWKAGKKTGKPRTIYFTPALTRALRRIWDRGAPHPVYVFVHGGGRGGKGACEPWPSGSVLSKTILRIRRELIAHLAAVRERVKAGESVTAWEARRAAVSVQDDGANRLVNYRWRHTAISALLMFGVDVPAVAELTGTSPDMIYKHYGHLLDSHLAAAADKLAGPRRASAG